MSAPQQSKAPTNGAAKAPAAVPTCLKCKGTEDRPNEVKGPVCKDCKGDPLRRRQEECKCKGTGKRGIFKCGKECQGGVIYKEKDTCKCVGRPKVHCSNDFHYATQRARLAALNEADKKKRAAAAKTKQNDWEAALSTGIGGF